MTPESVASESVTPESLILPAYLPRTWCLGQVRDSGPGSRHLPDAHEPQGRHAQGGTCLALAPPLASVLLCPCPIFSLLLSASNLACRDDRFNQRGKQKFLVRHFTDPKSVRNQVTDPRISVYGSRISLWTPNQSTERVEMCTLSYLSVIRPCNHCSWSIVTITFSRHT